MYALHYLSGPQEGQQINIDPQKTEILLGRSKEADIQIDDINVSRKHAKLKQDIDGIWIEDLKSKNGVMVNDQRIHEATLLKDADILVLGDLKLSFSDSNAALLKRLNTIPAFQESQKEPESENNTNKKETTETEPVPIEAIKPSKPWLDNLWIISVILVALGLITGILLWLID